MGFIALNLFSEEVDSLDHPTVQELKRILEEIAKTYKCSLTNFSIDHGVITFRFDNDEITCDILEDLKYVTGIHATAYGSSTNCDKMKKILDESQNSESIRESNDKLYDDIGINL